MSDQDVYYWHSTGGCARCDAMEGYHHGDEPDRPHPHCRCDIELVHTAGSECFMLYEDGSSADWSGHPDNGGIPLSGEQFEIIFSFEVHCLYTNLRDAFEVRVTCDTDDWFVFDAGGRAIDPLDNYDEAKDEAWERAREIAEELCECNEPFHNV
jgi:hypothetical protein